LTVRRQVVDATTKGAPGGRTLRSPPAATGDGNGPPGRRRARQRQAPARRPQSGV